MTMTEREALRRLLDVLPEADVREAARRLKDLRDKVEADPVLKALMNAPEDDEPISEEEEAAVAEARAELDRGEGIAHEEVKRRWGIA